MVYDILNTTYEEVFIMIYTNPVVKGFYPDPSVCNANGKYYMVCSSFQYFPGVPLFESADLVNWTQIGHVLTRKSQVALADVESSGGVFAPTIRYNCGRFYMVTTNNTTQTNFYVYADDIYGTWSDPITVNQGGIDPSLYFENGRTFFISNGTDDHGTYGIVQCEIDIHTGEKLSESQCIWQASHTLGREVFLTPVSFDTDGWFTAGKDGTTDFCYEMDGDFEQLPLKKYDFSTTDANIDWCYLRHPSMENYNWENEGLTLYGTNQTLDEPVSPTFVGLRHRDFSFQMYADLSLDSGEGGISVYSCENEHYDIALRAREDGNGYEAVLKLNIGNIKHTQSVLPLAGNHARLLIKGDALTYAFFIVQDGNEYALGTGLAKYVSTEVSGGFTGVVLGFYAVGENCVKVEDFSLLYNVE